MFHYSILYLSLLLIAYCDKEISNKAFFNEFDEFSIDESIFDNIAVDSSGAELPSDDDIEVYLEGTTKEYHKDNTINSDIKRDIDQFNIDLDEVAPIEEFIMDQLIASELNNFHEPVDNTFGITEATTTNTDEAAEKTSKKEETVTTETIIQTFESIAEKLSAAGELYGSTEEPEAIAKDTLTDSKKSSEYVSIPTEAGEIKSSIKNREDDTFTTDSLHYASQDPAVPLSPNSDIRLIPSTSERETFDFETTPENQDIAKDVDKIQLYSNLAEKENHDSPENKEIEKIHNKMIEHLIELTLQVGNPENTYKFLKMDGFERVVLPNIMVPNTIIRKQVLILVKHLFEVSPLSTANRIPLEMIHKMMEMFTNDDNLGIKAVIADILAIWLPDNPKVQEQIIKTKGIEPFYEEMENFDPSVIYTLLDMFNRIFEEHVRERQETKHTNKADFDRMKTYQRMGLIERMSTPSFCGGLLNIFSLTWQYNKNENNVMVPVLELIRISKEYCQKWYVNNPAAINVFTRYLEYLKNPETTDYISYLYSKKVQTENELEELMRNIKAPQMRIKDEF